MKLIELLNARKVIAKFSQEKLPVSVSYKLAKLIRSTDSDEVFYNEKISEIINKYRQKDEQGNFIETDANGIPLSEKTAEKCKEEIKELENTKVDMPNIKFKVEELGGLRLSVQEIFALDNLISE